MADPSPASTRVENEWNCACTPSYAFMSCAWPFLPLYVSTMIPRLTNDPANEFFG